MKFSVQPEVFANLDKLCFGVVVARGIDNKGKKMEIEDFLATQRDLVSSTFKAVQVKQHPLILPYREAFSQLGFNPNKFSCSVEALISRIAKGAQLPSINNIVDLANAISLKYILPIGAHDLSKLKDDLTLRFSDSEDIFVPFGMTEAEVIGPGELIYASGKQVKTRRWIWRQSEEGKITDTSTDIFFPIDGFKDINYAAVISARDELAEKLAKLFKCEIKTGYIDETNQSMDL